jgi:hypothetical protein
VPESYVRPVTSAREPKPEWRAVWRYRAVAFVLLVLAAVLTYWGLNKLVQPDTQDPTPRGPDSLRTVMETPQRPDRL